MQINVTTADIDGYPSSMAVSVSDTGKKQNIMAHGKPVPDINIIPQLMQYFTAGQTGVMNPGLRYLSPDRHVMVFEQPPRYVSFHYTSSGATEAGSARAKTKEYTIPVPWLCYVALLDNDAQPVTVYVFAMQHQLSSLDDPIAVLPLTNFYADGKLCRAPSDMNELGFPRSIAGAMGAVFYSVWMTGFNNDLIHTLTTAYQNATPKFLQNFQWKANKDAHNILEFWSRQTFDTVASDIYLPCAYKTLRKFLDSKTIHKDYEVDPAGFFVNRFYSALQNSVS